MTGYRYRQASDNPRERYWTDRYGRDREYGRFAREDFTYGQGQYRNEPGDWQPEDEATPRRFRGEGFDRDSAYRSYDSSRAENEEYDRIVHGEEDWRDSSFQDQSFQDRSHEGTGRFMGGEETPRHGRYASYGRYERGESDRFGDSGGPSAPTRGRDRYGESRYQERPEERRENRGWFGDTQRYGEAREQWSPPRGRWVDQSSGRDYQEPLEDDRRRSSGRGWFGDSQGHAEAARQRWDSQSGGRSGSHRRDGGRGWHGEPRRHAEAARRGWQDR